MVSKRLFGVRRIGVTRNKFRAVSLRNLLVNMGAGYKRTHKSKSTLGKRKIKIGAQKKRFAWGVFANKRAFRAGLKKYRAGRK